MTYLNVKTIQGPPSPFPIPEPQTWFAPRWGSSQCHISDFFKQKVFKGPNNEMSVIYKYVTWHIYMAQPPPPSLTPKLDLHLNEVHLNVTFPMFWNKRFLGTKQWNVSDYQIFFYKYVTWHIYMLRQFRDPSPLDLPIPDPPTWLALK